MKRVVSILVLALVLLPATAFSQTRRRSTPKTPPRPNLAQQRAAEIQRDGATRVADQIKILTKFIYLLGGVAKGLESVDDAARRNQASPAAIDQAEKSKAVVRNSIRNVRDGLDQLESHIRATPELQRYYIKIAGVAAGASTAEQQAGANQFDKAGRTLLDVVGRLTDALQEM
ncbi:MAG TPA: hypothetical protein VEW46_02380 [Pyrinomonadaceae bacterium]|nr:hypothetical protein [Pyrinomonadaceae bacterium]